MRATLAVVRRIGKELMERGTYSSVFDGTIPYTEVTELISRAASNSTEKAHG
jgi:hypothetical protein